MAYTQGQVVQVKTPLSVGEMQRRGVTLDRWEAPVINGFINMDEAIYFYKPQNHNNVG